MKRVFALLAVVALACPALVAPVVLAPPDAVEETLKFDSGVFGGFAVTGQYEYHAAVRFTPEKPCSVVAVVFYQYDASAEDGRVYIYGANTSTRPGTRLAQATYPGSGTMRWKRVNIAQPVPVDSGVDFWTCVTTTYYTGDHPLAVDRGPLVRNRGGFIKVPLMGETWYQLSDAPFYENRNWNQRAIVLSLTGLEEELTPAAPVRRVTGATVVRGVLHLTQMADGLRRELLDACGRRVFELRPGANDVSGLAPGVYFIHEAYGMERRTSGVSKVVVTR